MTDLKNILYKVNLTAVVGSTGIDINAISFDSRMIQKGDVFVAIKGTASDGHEFISKAIENGAIAIVCEQIPEEKVEGITYVAAENASRALGIMASNFYNAPSENLKLVGVTGTNGKTTIVSLLYELLKKAGYKTGLLSTVKIMIDEEEIEATHTTPDPITINKHLQSMNEAGVEYCFMEVSSHGLDQNRVHGLQFAGGIFTNLTHDHLDYHKSFSAYRDSKKSFFDELPSSAFSLVNIDDKNGLVMIQNTVSKKRGDPKSPVRSSKLDRGTDAGVAKCRQATGGPCLKRSGIESRC